MGRMSEPEIENFLSRPLICHLGCLTDQGQPFVVPLWFQYADGGIYLVARARASWASYVQRDARVSLCIGTDLSERVLVQGEARIIETPNVGGRWVPIGREMAERYAGPENGPRYFEQTASEPRWLIFVVPHKLMGWAGGWARHYKHSDW